MKSLLFNNKEYQAEKIVKTNTDIIGYTGGKEIFAFRGINDFSQFQLVNGASFDPDPEQEKEQRIADLEAAVAALLGGVV